MITLLALTALYFLPTIVAAHHGHHSTLAIGLLNFFLGWTLIGWAIALVWALSQPRVVVVQPVYWR